MNPAFLALDVPMGLQYVTSQAEDFIYSGSEADLPARISDHQGISMTDSPAHNKRWSFAEVRGQESSWYPIRAMQGLAAVTQYTYYLGTTVSSGCYPMLSLLLNILQRKAMLVAVLLFDVMLDFDLFYIKDLSKLMMDWLFFSFGYLGAA